MPVSGGLESAQNVSETVTTNTSSPDEKVRTRRTTIKVGAVSGGVNASTPGGLDSHVLDDAETSAIGPLMTYTQVSTEQTIYKDDEVTSIQNSVETTSQAFTSTRSERRKQNPDGSVTSTSMSVQDVPGLKTSIASSSTFSPDGTKETNTSNSISGALVTDTETKTQVVESPNGDTRRIEMVSTGQIFDKTVTTTMTAFDSASGQTRTKVTTVKSGEAPTANVTVTKPASRPTRVPAEKSAVESTPRDKPVTGPKKSKAERSGDLTPELPTDASEAEQALVDEQSTVVPQAEQALVDEQSAAAPNIAPTRPTPMEDAKPAAPIGRSKGSGKRKEPQPLTSDKKSVSVVIPEVGMGDMQDDVTRTAQIPIALIEAD